MSATYRRRLKSWGETLCIIGVFYMFFKTGDTGGTLVAGRGCSFILGKLVTQFVVPLPTCSVCDALKRRMCVRVGWGWVVWVGYAVCIVFVSFLIVALLPRYHP